jgi:general stress protein 26
MLRSHHTLSTRTFLNADEQALDFLKDRPAGVIATVGPNGDPHAAVIYYAIDDAFAVTFLTKRGTKKSDNLVHHNHAMLVVFDLPSQTSVQIAGKVEEITDKSEVQQVFRDTLRASLHSGRTAIPPIVKLHAGTFVAYKLTPVRVRLAAYNHTDPHIPAEEVRPPEEVTSSRLPSAPAVPDQL